MITQLVAGTYTYSGQSIPPASIGGLDILIAKQLDSGALPARVDRFAAPLPAQSNILNQIQNLLSQITTLNPAITQAAVAAAKKTQLVTNGKGQLTVLADQMKAVLEKNPTQELDKPPYKDLQDRYTSVSGQLPDQSGGLTAEYALIKPWEAGEAVAFGLESFYAARHGSMRKALENVARDPRPKLE